MKTTHWKNKGNRQGFTLAPLNAMECAHVRIGRVADSHRDFQNTLSEDNRKNHKYKRPGAYDTPGLSNTALAQVPIVRKLRPQARYRQSFPNT